MLESHYERSEPQDQNNIVCSNHGERKKLSDDWQKK